MVLPVHLEREAQLVAGRDDVAAHVQRAAITEAADPDANIIFGAIVDESMSGEVKITVIATGFEEGLETKKPARPPMIETAPIATVQTPTVQPTPSYPSYTDENEYETEAEEDELEVPAFIRRKLK